MINPTHRRYFSLNGEDYLLWRLFDRHDAGYYIDVGAFDGVLLSNTRSFELEGWRGICIEPLPQFCEACRKNRPNALCLNLACVGSESISTTEFHTEPLGLLSGIRGDRAEDIRLRYQRRGLDFEGFARMTVPAATLNAILDRHLPPCTQIDFISIDVEGTETDVLCGFDLARFRPRAMVIEANCDRAAEEISAMLADRAGYGLARRLNENLIFVRDPADAAPLRDVPIDCEFECPAHPLGEKYTAYRADRKRRTRDESAAAVPSLRRATTSART